MAKLTESYLRGMIKQALNEMDDKSYLYDLEDEAYGIGEKEVESAVEHHDELLAALDEIDAAILDLQNDETESALFALKDARKVLNSIAGRAGDAIETTAKKGSAMGKYAYSSGMPSAQSEFGTTRSMDEARKRNFLKKK